MKAPEHLSGESKREWRRFSKLFTIDENAAAVLREYFEVAERKQAAQAVIEADGLTIVDRFQQKRAHPCLAVIRDCQSLMLRCLKSLPLDGDKPTKPWSGGRKRRGESREEMMAKHEAAKAALSKERTQ